jgi:glucosamine--fructose-6-phosphate aminotransferase (isomerizing)
LKSLMLTETLEAAEVVTRQMASDQALYDDFGALLRGSPQHAMLTLARGSSDHAAHFLAYLTMSRLGQLVTSMPMSLVTLYHSHFNAKKIVSFAFSQSGQSPDLIEPTRLFRSGGGITAAFVNQSDSPLAREAQWLFPLHAGEEKSVAATKSFIAQLVAGARVVAHWQENRQLEKALSQLPDIMAQAVQVSWQEAVDTFVSVDRLMVIGRGTGMPVALEAALKLKETCSIQAEAFSGAEVRHGPMRLIEEGYPLLVFAPRGPTQPGLLSFAAEMRERGAKVLLAAPVGTEGMNLPIMASHDIDLDPVSMIQSFYPMVEALARAKGFDPDQPRFLSKVTRTQ